MGKNGRDYAKVNFDIKKITLKFENIFKKLIQLKYEYRSDFWWVWFHWFILC